MMTVFDQYFIEHWCCHATCVWIVILSYCLLTYNTNVQYDQCCWVHTFIVHICATSSPSGSCNKMVT